MKTQQTPTHTTQTDLQTRRIAMAETEQSIQAAQAKAQHTQPASQPLETAPERKELTFEQKDFICKQLAAFNTYKQVAGLFLAEFPDSGFTFDQVLKRIKYYACDNRTRKWRWRIVTYRKQLNHNLSNRFRLANRYERLRHLEAMFHEALQPRVKRLFWYPTRRRKDDKITYRTVKIREKDLATAAKILSLIVKELDPDSLEAIDDPFMLRRQYQHPDEFAQEADAFEKQDPDASRDLDKTFGLI